MTTPTKEQCVQWARECGGAQISTGSASLLMSPDELHAFALRVLEQYGGGRDAEWISVKDSLPPFIEGKDYSENVLAICNGVLAICNRYFEGEYWYWCRASSFYGDLRKAECEFDDDYTVTHWMPLPTAPAIDAAIEAEKVSGGK